MSQAGEINVSSNIPGVVDFLEGNSGGPVGPNASNIIFVVGSGSVDVVGNPGTNTLTITDSGTLMWNDVTGTSASASPNNGYLADNAGLVTVTLPAVCAQFSVVAIAGGNLGSGGWQLAQNAGQQINFGTSTTTLGATGYLASTNQYDCAWLLCTTANTNFIVLNSVGNITVH